MRLCVCNSDCMFAIHPPNLNDGSCKDIDIYKSGWEKKNIISKKISMFLLFEQIGLYNFIDYFSFFFSFVFALDRSLSDTISNGYKLVGFDN